MTEEQASRIMDIFDRAQQFLEQHYREHHSEELAQVLLDLDEFRLSYYDQS